MVIQFTVEAEHEERVPAGTVLERVMKQKKHEDKLNTGFIF